MKNILSKIFFIVSSLSIITIHGTATYGWLEKITIAKKASGPFYYVQIQTLDTGNNPCIQKIPSYTPICVGGEYDCAPIGCFPYIIAPFVGQNTEVELSGFVFPYKSRSGGVIKIAVLNEDGTEKNITYLQDQDQQNSLCIKKQKPNESTDINTGWQCWKKQELTDDLVEATINENGETAIKVFSQVKKDPDCGKDALCNLRKGLRTAIKPFEPVGDFFKETVYEKGLRDNVYEKVLKPFGDNVEKYGKIVGKMMENWGKGRPTPDYCKLSANLNLPNPPTIDSKEAQDQDTDGLLPYIKKYAPVAWLEGSEDYYPMTFSEYIMAPTTSLISRESDDTTVAKDTILAPGKITMEKLYAMSKDPSKYNPLNLAFNIANCTQWGANPEKNKDSKGNLTTPIYAATFEQNEKLYIQYLFFYGYNGAYNIGPLQGEVVDIQDYHEGDLEHVTMELDKKTKKLLRIYFSAHSRTEGFWLNANDPKVEYEGTHPVVYIAHYSHAAYPKEGTYVRIYGAANDITGKGQKWLPQIMRIYAETDSRFDPKTMGFMYFPGNYGVHGVQHLTGQSWFMNTQGDIGRDYSGFCNNPSSAGGFAGFFLDAASKMEYEACIISKIPSAKAPE